MTIRIPNTISRQIPQKKPVILHVYGGEENSGEERILLEVMKNPALANFNQIVVDLHRTPQGGTQKPSTSLSILGPDHYIALPLDLHAKGKQKENVQTIAETLAHKRIHPDVIMGWAAPGNAYATFLAKQRNIPLALRLSNPRPFNEMPAEEQLVVPAMIEQLKIMPFNAIALSEEVRKRYTEMGLPEDNIKIIHNGIDVNIFKPEENKNMRNKTRETYKLPPDKKLIGVVARFDPQKGVKEFVEAASIIHADEKFKNVHFVMVGEANTTLGKELTQRVMSSDLKDVIHFIPTISGRKDLAALYNAFDIFTLPSHSEAFGNVIVEAMACGTPVVVTHTGMAQEMVSGIGEIVPLEKDSTKLPAKLPSALAKAWKTSLGLADDKQLARTIAGRTRACDRYSMEQMMASYGNFWTNMIPEKKQGTYVSGPPAR